MIRIKNRLIIVSLLLALMLSGVVSVWAEPVAAKDKGASNLYGWGDNRFGQLADLSLSDKNRPVAISLPGNVTAESVVAGGSFNLATGSDGKLYGWGKNN